jgi:hypothetical protein
MDGMLGIYGGELEYQFSERFSAWVSGSFSFIDWDDSGYRVITAKAGARFYAILSDNEGYSGGLWFALGGGVKFADVTVDGVAYEGVLPLLDIHCGVKIPCGRFYFEPYGGYSVAFGGIEGLSDYTGYSSIYGASVGIVF